MEEKAEELYNKYLFKKLDKVFITEERQKTNNIHKEFVGGEKYHYRLVDDFNDFVPFDNFGKILAYIRSVHVELTLCSTSLHRLSELYGETSLEHIISYFNKIIYLFANDEYTLEFISNLCGNKRVDEKLISPTELKLLKQFEAIVIKSRHLPFKTKLLPYYQYKK